MRSLTIGEKNSSTDFGLALSTISIGIPEIKEYRVPLPGGHGDLDFTDFFGEQKLNNRTIEAEFVYGKFPSENIPQDIMFEVINEWHGRKLEITDSLDPDHKYIGRVMLTDLDGRRNYSIVRLTAICDPYRLETSPTVLSGTIPAGGTLYLTADILRMSVLPEITVSAATAVTYGEKQQVIQAGTYPLSEKLPEGQHALKFVGAEGTTVGVKYTRGLI